MCNFVGSSLKYAFNCIYCCCPILSEDEKYDKELTEKEKLLKKCADVSERIKNFNANFKARESFDIQNIVLELIKAKNEKIYQDEKHFCDLVDKIQSEWFNKLKSLSHE